MSPLLRAPHHLWLVLAILSDGFWIWLAFLLGYGIRALSPHALLPLDIYQGFATVCVLCYWGIEAGLAGYDESKLLSRFDEVVLVLVGLCLAFGVVLAGAFFIRSISLSRLVVGYAGVIAFLGLVVTRILLRRLMGYLRSRGHGIQAVVWVGHNALLEDVLDRLQRSPQLGFRLVGRVEVPVEVPTDPIELEDPWGKRDLELPIVTDLAHLSHYLQTHPQIQEVWFAQPELATAELLFSLQCRGADRIQIRLLPDILTFLTVNLSLQSLDGVPLLTLNDPPLRYWHNRLLKRGLDICGSLLGLILLGPLFLLISLGVQRSSPGPILYRQERISLDGRSFWIYKFRTMRVDAEIDQTPGWTRSDDPRRTPLGAILRRLNLDELPQLWNVLRGEMSLVGPRPERPYYVHQFSQEIPKYLDRHLVKTGMTGWAQIHGLRGDTSIPRRTQYDLYYVQNWSLLLDLRIIFMTLWQGVQGKIEGY